MVDGIGTTNYTYDNANRLTQVEGPYKTVSYGYDNGGRRTSLGITGQNNVGYSYNAADYLTSLTNANSETTSWTYNDVGLPTRQDNANSTYAQWTYDSSRYWITDVHNKKSDASTISRFQYTRDSVGNPTAMTETNATLGAQSPWSYTFTYDNVYQLTGETKKDKDQSTVYTISYEYDAAGNRTKKTEDGNVTDYTYDDFNKMTAAGSTSFGYDNNGNMTSKTENSQTTSYSYDYENHMTGITYPDQSTNSFGYYGTGQRAWKVDSAGTTRFVYDEEGIGAGGILAELDGAGGYVAVYTEGRALVSQRRGGQTSWYTLDAASSVSALTASSGAASDAYSYTAFGEIAASSGTTPNPLKFAGDLSYYTDTDSGLLSAGARYYWPGVGRFTAPDRSWFPRVGAGLWIPPGRWGDEPATSPTELSQCRRWVEEGIHLGRKCVPKQYRHCFELAVFYSAFVCQKGQVGRCKKRGPETTCGYASGTNRIVLCYDNISQTGPCNGPQTVVHELIHVGCHRRLFPGDDYRGGGEVYSYYIQAKCGGGGAAMELAKMWSGLPGGLDDILPKWWGVQ